MRLASVLPTRTARLRSAWLTPSAAAAISVRLTPESRRNRGTYLRFVCFGDRRA
jgi:hypothetical protein